MRKVLTFGLVSLLLMATSLQAQSVILGEYRPGRAAAASSLSLTLSTEDKAVLDAIAASLSVMDDWDESDRLKVNLVLGQAGVAAGNGTAGVDTLRVTIASNSTGIIGVTQSGTWNVGTLTTITNVVHVDDNSGSLTVDNAGTFAVQAAGTKTNNNAAPGATNIGALTVVANASAPTWTEGNLVALSSDLAGALRVAGAVSCSNCTGTGASKVDDAAFGIATDSVAPAGFLADQTLPDSVNEGDVGLARMTLARIQLHTLWDAAGNERGANVNASNELLVALSSVPSHAVTNAGTFAVQAAQAGTWFVIPADSGGGDMSNTTLHAIKIDPGSAALALGKLEDAAAASGDLGVMVLTKRTDSAATSAGTDGDYATLNTDGSGRLWVNCGTGCSGGTQYAEDAAHASGDTGTLALAVRRDTAASSSGTDGDNSTLNVDANGRMWTNIFGVTQAASTYLTVRLTDGSSYLAGSTDYTHDAALTLSTTAGPVLMAHASAAAPTNVSADDDAVAIWALKNGSQVMNLAAGSTLITSTSTSLNVNCTGGCSGGTQYTHDAALTIGSSSVTLAGGRASAAAPTDVSADNDAVAAWMLRSGATVVQPSYGGTLASTGTGASGGGVPRVQLANESLAIGVEDAAETAAGNLLMIGAVRRDTLASSAGTSGDNATVNTNALGALWTAPSAASNGGATPCYIPSAASTNATNCAAAAANLYGIEAVNTTSTTYYLRLYNLASSPTCSSATGYVRTVPIPNNAGTGAGMANFYSVGEAYGTGLGFCLTGGGSSTDNTNAATGVYVTLHYK
jgi:hypothetical protein